MIREPALLKCCAFAKRKPFVSDPFGPAKSYEILILLWLTTHSKVGDPSSVIVTQELPDRTPSCSSLDPLQHLSRYSCSEGLEWGPERLHRAHVSRYDLGSSSAKISHILTEVASPGPGTGAKKKQYLSVCYEREYVKALPIPSSNRSFLLSI